MENVDHGLLEHWLMNIRNVQRLHLEELEVSVGIGPPDWPPYCWTCPGSYSLGVRTALRRTDLMPREVGLLDLVAEISMENTQCRAEEYHSLKMFALTSRNASTARGLWIGRT